MDTSFSNCPQSTLLISPLRTRTANTQLLAAKPAGYIPSTSTAAALQPSPKTCDVVVRCGLTSSFMSPSSAPLGDIYDDQEPIKYNRSVCDLLWSQKSVPTERRAVLVDHNATIELQLIVCDHPKWIFVNSLSALYQQFQLPWSVGFLFIPRGSYIVVVYDDATVGALMEWTMPEYRDKTTIEGHCE